MPKDLSPRHYSEADQKQESIVSPCSSGLATKDPTCFIDVACIDHAYELPAVRATGQLQWQSLPSGPKSGNVSAKRWGTAFFITPDCLMTAGHCFDVCDDPKGWVTPKTDDGTPLGPFQLATKLQLNMQYRELSCSPLVSFAQYNEKSFAVSQLIEYRNAGLDYAIFKVEGSPGSTYGYISSINLNFESGKIHIVQHPQGAAQKIELDGYTERKGNFLKYRTNTLGGSSGSAVMDYYHLLCGVHILGVRASNSKTNSAVHVAAIAKVSPFLQLLLSNPIPKYQFQPVQITVEDKSSRNKVWGISLITSSAVLGVCAVGSYKQNKKNTTALFTLFAIGLLVGGIVVLTNDSEQVKLVVDEKDSDHVEEYTYANSKTSHLDYEGAVSFDDSSPRLMTLGNRQQLRHDADNQLSHYREDAFLIIQK